MARREFCHSQKRGLSGAVPPDPLRLITLMDNRRKQAV
jgi:hypothetical protein